MGRKKTSITIGLALVVNSIAFFVLGIGQNIYFIVGIGMLAPGIALAVVGYNMPKDGETEDETEDETES